MGPSTLYQYLVIICANIATIGYGGAVGWHSAAFLVLESDETPLEQGPLTVSEISWVGSLVGIGGIAGTLLTGWICEKYGRRPALLLMAFPLLINWILVIYARSVWFLYVSRFLCGIVGGGVFAAVPLLVGEVSEDKIRGALGSLVTLAGNVGVLFGFIAGNYLSYEMVPKVHLVLPIIFLAFYFFFPESPWYLIKQNKVEEAEKSLRFYRNIGKNSSKEKEEWFLQEFNKFKSTYQKDTKPTDEDSKITLKDFVCKPVSIGIAILIFHDFCGVYTMVNYTGKIFAESGSELPPNQSAVIVGFIQLLGTYVSTILVDRVGRKTLFSLSCLGTGIGLVVLGTYIYLSTSVGMDLRYIQWIPVVSFSATLFIASCGTLPVPYVILGEIMPDKIRGPATVGCLLLTWFNSFLLVKIFAPFVASYGLHVCIYFFAFWCFAGVVYTVIYLPETKGRSLADIEKSFKNSK